MPEARAAEQDGGGGTSFFRTAIQSVGLFLLIQFVMKQIVGSVTSNANSQPGAQPIPAFTARPSMTDLEGPINPIPQNIAPIWAPDSSLDICMYISSSIVMPPHNSLSPETLVLEERQIKMDNWSDTREIHASFNVPKAVQNNGTIWGHIYVALSGYPLDPTAKNYDQSKAYHFMRPLNQYHRRKKVAKTRNLLSGGNETEEANEERESVGEQPIVSYYHPNFTMSLIPNGGAQVYPSLHPAVREWIQLERTGARDASGQNGWYYPIFFLNDFWQLRSHMSQINDTVTRLPLNIHLNTLSYWKFSLLTSWDYGMKENAKAAASGNAGFTGSKDGGEFEQIKQILLDSNIYLLATTGVVSILHMFFEMLAFKNDLSHWRNKKDNVGVSVRSILANVFMQSVIFLYLMDNNENTSWMILFSQGLGIALEAWKITKTVNVRVRPTAAGSRNPLPYSITFEDKHKLSETEVKTQEYDQIAFKYLYWVAVPLLLAYAGYSLYYETHKSWYSFIIATLVGSVYAYGFLMMVPSLYINYRLKSVAHMPGRALMYKTLNTFIDDLFAFTIKMPTLHRIATLRDDVIFFIYLYQAWKYKVDYTRINEFGQGGDDEIVPEIVPEKLTAEPLKSPAEGATADGEATSATPKLTGGKISTATGREGSDARKRITNK